MAMGKKKEEDKEKNAAEDVVVENVVEDVVETVDEVTKYKRLADDNLDRLQRTIAEFDNFRKRTAKEKTSMYDDGVRDTVLQILPVIDNFERAMQSPSNEEDSFYKGINMILKQFEGILDCLGVVEIAAQDAQFDSAIHCAVVHVEDESYGENTVIEVLQKGYQFKDKVIRHSMVKVAN